MECIICFEKNESIISCENCKNNMCKICINTWFEKNGKLNCVSCNQKWTWFFLYKNLHKNFNDLHEHYKEKLIDKEKLYIPYTQKYTNAHKCLYKLLDIHDNYNNKSNTIFLENIEKDISYIDDYINEKNYIFFKSIIYDDINKSFLIKDYISNSIKNNKICKCINVECKGYIMSENYMCGMCNIKICNKCHCLLTTCHLCNENDIKSINLIEEDTKPCPTCTVRIYKYEGCDQAYCTQCKTAFSYNTGKIEKGRIHNPHYYEELKKIKDESNQCEYNYCEEDEPSFFIYKENKKDKIIDRIKIYNIIHRYYVHNFGILENKYNYKILPEINDDEYHDIDFYTNINSRIMYMLGGKYGYNTDNEFVDDLFVNYRYLNFKIDIYDLMMDFLNIFKIILINMKKFLLLDYENKSIINVSIIDNLFKLLKNEVCFFYKNKLLDLCDFYYVDDSKKIINDFYFLDTTNFEYVNIEYNI